VVKKRLAAMGAGLLVHGFAYAAAATTACTTTGTGDTTTTDNLSLQVKVDASLSLAVGMELVNNTSPPPGSARHTDTVMTVNLVYELKNPKLAVTGTAPQAVSDLSLP
jgi:hypothetical protein